MGPTAIGKSALGVYLAQHLDCEIISVDSMLVFQGMDVGTAKPTLQQQGGIPHHLIDILDPVQSYSAGQFRQRALALIESIIERGKTPLLVGGTMLYFKSLLSGLAPLPDADPMIRAQLEQQAAHIGWQAMHDQLASVDADAALRIHPNDPQRIQRALEIHAISGQTMSELIRDDAGRSPAYEFITVSVVPEDRSRLHASIHSRFDTMLEQGLVEETTLLYARDDLNANLPAMRAVGYRQVWAFLDKQLDYATMTERAVIATRQLAKRQLTWLRGVEVNRQYTVGATVPHAEILLDLDDVLG
jgi:tRNA dimethylallyltransferase